MVQTKLKDMIASRRNLSLRCQILAKNAREMAFDLVQKSQDQMYRYKLQLMIKKMLEKWLGYPVVTNVGRVGDIVRMKFYYRWFKQN